MLCAGWRCGGVKVLPLLGGFACKVCLQHLSKIHYRRDAFCFLPLAAILESPSALLLVLLLGSGAQPGVRARVCASGCFTFSPPAAAACSAPPPLQGSPQDWRSMTEGTIGWGGMHKGWGHSEGAVEGTQSSLRWISRAPGSVKRSGEEQRLPCSSFINSDASDFCVLSQELRSLINRMVASRGWGE
jgi:hypothetical protein